LQREENQSLPLLLQVCAAGALLTILHKEDLLVAPTDISSGQQLDMSGDSEFLFSVECLAEFSLHGQLIVDPASMRALQIFQV
jgi:hypothetical protein